MVAQGETDPLLSPSRTNGKYYFLNKQDVGYTGGTTSAVRDDDGAPVVQVAPEGTTDDEFAPRPVTGNKTTTQQPKHTPHKFAGQQSNTESNGGFISSLLSSIMGQSNQQQQSRGYGEVVPGPVKMRKAPVKIEPKVFFANERTFLAWMHLSVILAGASIAILAFAEDSNPMAQLYGIVLLPVSIAFIVYSMYQYGRRARMIRHRHPGPYEDTVGPVVLAIMLMCSIVAQFALKLYTMTQ